MCRSKAPARRVNTPKAVGADCAVAIGGGSTIGLGKAIALESAIPIMAVPTTYAGSEMTPIYGITEAGLKKTGKDARVLPRTVLYDPNLIGHPAAWHVDRQRHERDRPCRRGSLRQGWQSGHVPDGGGRNSGTGQRTVGIAGNDSRHGSPSQCLYGAWLCGTVLGHVGMALHHKLCHTLGGSFVLPHAETHTVVLPHALAYNAPAAPEAMARIAAAIGEPEAPLGLHRLALRLGAPTALRDIGMKEEDLDRACEIALSNPYWNPRPIERQPIRDLLQRAWEGAPPEA